MLSRATERVGLEWRKPPCPEPSRLDDWLSGSALPWGLSPGRAWGAYRSWTAPFTARKPTLLTPPPSPPSVVQLGVTGVPPVERSVAMQVCPYTVSTRQGKPCLLFRACRYSSGRRGLCGLWRCCLHLMLRRYCRFFRLKALGNMHGGWLRSGSSERAPYRTWPRATSDEGYGTSLGRAMSTLVVQERHLAVSGWHRDADKFGSSRFLYPRLASSATQPVTWPSSSRLHRSRLRRSNTSCLGGQLLPYPSAGCSAQPSRRRGRPPASTPAPAPQPQQPPKAGAVELGVGRPPRPSWPPSTGGKRRSERPRDGQPRERGNCFGRG